MSELPRFIRDAFPNPYETINGGQAWSQTICDRDWIVFSDGAGAVLFPNHFAYEVKPLNNSISSHLDKYFTKAFKTGTALVRNRDTLIASLITARQCTAVRIGPAVLNIQRLIPLLKALPQNEVYQYLPEDQRQDPVIMGNHGGWFALMSMSTDLVDVEKIFVLEPKPTPNPCKDIIMPGYMKAADIRPLLLGRVKHLEEALKVLDDAERLGQSGEFSSQLRAYDKLKKMIPDLPSIESVTHHPLTTRISNIGKVRPAEITVCVDDQYEA